MSFNLDDLERDVHFCQNFLESTGNYFSLGEDTSKDSQFKEKDPTETDTLTSSLVDEFLKPRRGKNVEKEKVAKHVKFRKTLSMVEFDQDESGQEGFFTSETNISDGALMVEELVSESSLNPMSEASETESEHEQFKQIPRQLSEKIKPTLKPLTRALIQKELDEYTFKPKINRLPFSSKNRNIPINKRIEAWVSQHVEKMKAQESEMEKVDEEDLKECTFKPKITSNSKQKAKLVNTSKDVVERLFEKANVRHALRERKKQRLEEQERNQFTFRPTLKKSKKYLEHKNYKPIYNRIGELQRTKQAKALRLKCKVENEEQCTFKPQINKKSKEIAKKLQNQEGRISERLSQTISSNVYRSLRRQARQKEEESKECTFKPQINPCSREIAESKDLGIPKEQFLERQEIYKLRALERQLEVIDFTEKKLNCTFKPKIGNAEKVLQKSRRHSTRLQVENQSEFYQRLSHLDSNRKIAKEEIIRKKELEKYPFRPKITQKSKIIGRPTTIEELTSREVKERKVKRLKLQKHRQFRESHPFKPQTTKGGKSKNVKSSGFDDICSISIMENIEKYRKVKEANLKKKRKEFEKAMMQECTFQPATLKSRVKKPKKVIIRGLDDFLRQRKKAKEKDEQILRREKEVFNVNPDLVKTAQCEGVTIPKPFKLAEAKNSNSSRRQRALAESLKIEMNEKCSFAPKTINTLSRKTINRILHEDTSSDTSFL